MSLVEIIAAGIFILAYGLLSYSLGYKTGSDDAHKWYSKLKEENDGPK